MVRAGVEGLAAGAREGGHAVPVALAVTVLTSDPNVDARDARMRVARDAGCGGVVCAGSDVEFARALGLRTMVPGIRLAGGAAHDQARVDTPGDAIARGADWLVIGRAVTGADDPERAGSRGDARRWRPRSRGSRPEPVVRREALRILAAAVVPEVAGCHSPLRSPPSNVKPHSRRRPRRASRACRSEGEAQAGFTGVGRAVRPEHRDDALAKLKVVSVLESLPGVGKVQARRIMEELDISESRRLRGLGRNQREGLLCHPKIVRSA